MVDICLCLLNLISQCDFVVDNAPLAFLNIKNHIFVNYKSLLKKILTMSNSLLVSEASEQ